MLLLRATRRLSYGKCIAEFISNYHTKDANRDKKIYMLSMLFKSCTYNFFPAVEAAFPGTKAECGCPPHGGCRHMLGQDLAGLSLSRRVIDNVGIVDIEQNMIYYKERK